MWKTARSTDRLAKVKAPYNKKVEIIRAKKLPLGLYGCEVAPINESALRTRRASIASCLTFTTARRSADLAFAIGSRGRDVDPDVEIVCRRAIAIRRSMAKDDRSRKLIQEILWRGTPPPSCALAVNANFTCVKWHKVHDVTTVSLYNI